MDAVADQKVYGPNGEKATAAAEQAFREMENRLSVYKEGSDIARLNAAAGSGEAVAVEAQTYALLSQAENTQCTAGGAFELTIAPLALAWGITTDAPRVLQQDEIDALLPLVDDRGLLLESGTARLQRPGQAVDLAVSPKEQPVTLRKRFMTNMASVRRCAGLAGAAFTHGA